MLKLIVFAPLIGAIINGLFGNHDHLGIEFANLRHPVQECLDQLLRVGHRGIVSFGRGVGR